MDPVDKTYLLVNGKAYAGVLAPTTGLPAWRTAIPAGHFADISLNTMLSAEPTGWPAGDDSGPFINWSSAVAATDYSELGAYTTHGSGHLQEGAVLWAGVWNFDLSTRLWVGSNVPAVPMTQPASVTPIPGYNTYYESTDSATLGHPYPTHTYDGLGYQPAANGGGAKGSLLRVFIGGGSAPNCIHKFNLASATAPPTRVVDTSTFGGSSAGTYPATADDRGRGGVWALANNGNGPLTFFKWSDWSTTTYSSVAFNVYSGLSLVYLPAPYDCLVSMGPDVAAGPIVIRVSKIISDVPQPFVLVTQSGTACPQPNCGGDWCPPLGAIVSYNSGAGVAVDYDVYKLTPPIAANLTSGTWAWSHQTMVGMTGQAPSNPGTNPNNGFPMNTNGSWSKMRYFASVNALIWCNTVNGPVQAFVLTGM